ncbi:unnamed protein product [Rotaria sp. Silwood1]|nr:unnamed protein product [Rotaria sp. Silwood1]CAF3491228.1 unnamed protein product [Rotaria sp. Silwood1]CAF3517887.1 unnamed protein product [Rotaria sp. Silwood1]CAF3547228.1 unnamed protein product [Rotaria sp. Silwood1]CAF3574987.1 unnamed protein product [Rotaria sp. Silwood1]
MASSKQTKKILTQGKHIIKSASNKRPRSTSDHDVKIQVADDSQEESLQQTNTKQKGKQDKRQKIIHPNAFLSFRITNQQIIDYANEVQKQIIESNPLLSKASISIPTLHITLMVFALKTDDDKQRLVE